MRALRALARPVPPLASRSLSSAGASPSPVVFPREGAGVNYALNWQLCDVSVIPQHHVARNVKPSKPIATIDAASAAGKLYQVSSINKGQTVTPFGDLLAAIGASEANELLTAATQGLSSVAQLHVEDGAVGTAGGSDVSVRVISDSAAVSAYARVVLAGSTPRTQRPVVTAYVLSSMSGSSTVKAGSAVVNAQSQTVVFVGVPSPSLFRSALAAAASPSISASGNVCAPGAFIPSTRTAVIGVVDALKLNSASTLGHIISQSGSSRLFACTPAAAAASAGDFTVNCAGSPQVLRPGRTAYPALLPAPASLVIAVADKSNALPSLAPLTPAAAAFFYLAGRFAVVADPIQHALNLKTLIEKSGAKAYLVNTASADASGSVAAAAAGNAPPATIKKNDVTGDAIKRVSALVAGHKAANEILEGASQVFV